MEFIIYFMQFITNREKLYFYITIKYGYQKNIIIAFSTPIFHQKTHNYKNNSYLTI